MEQEEKFKGTSWEDFEKQFDQKGYLILEKGTKYDLELIYTLSKWDKNVTYPDLDLEEPILVGRRVFYHRGKEKGEYKFPITNSKILHLERESTDFQRELINAFGISEDYYECEYPESLGDIDMSLFAHKHPDEVEQIAEIENPYTDAILEEQERLNKAFVKSVLGEGVDLEDLVEVRIVTEL